MRITELPDPACCKARCLGPSAKVFCNLQHDKDIAKGTGLLGRVCAAPLRGRRLPKRCLCVLRGETNLLPPRNWGISSLGSRLLPNSIKYICVCGELLS